MQLRLAHLMVSAATKTLARRFHIRKNAQRMIVAKQRRFAGMCIMFYVEFSSVLRIYNKA